MGSRTPRRGTHKRPSRREKQDAEGSQCHPVPSGEGGPAAPILGRVSLLPSGQGSACHEVWLHQAMIADTSLWGIPLGGPLRAPGAQEGAGEAHQSPSRHAEPWAKAHLRPHVGLPGRGVPARGPSQLSLLSQRPRG